MIARQLALLGNALAGFGAIRRIAEMSISGTTLVGIECRRSFVAAAVFRPGDYTKI